VAIGRAGNVEAKGMVEHGRIAIGRHLPVANKQWVNEGVAKPSQSMRRVLS
jgi:hypothetical protein